MPFFRCNICNVVSRDIIQHDRHLRGKRHANNVAAALGEAPVSTDNNSKRRRDADGANGNVKGKGTRWAASNAKKLRRKFGLESCHVVACNTCETRTSGEGEVLTVGPVGAAWWLVAGGWWLVAGNRGW